MILNIIILEQLSVVYVCAHVCKYCCKLTCVCRRACIHEISAKHVVA